VAGKKTAKGGATDGQVGAIRVGIGGWTFDPWRTTFYPSEVPKKNELAWASTQVTAIEINATYYRTQSESSFTKWHDETPDDFIFAVKASRFATNRRTLSEAGDSIGHFVGSGVARLGPKLGPILWQFMPTKKFVVEDFAAFLALLPPEVDGVRLRHALEVRHESFRCEAFVDLMRQHGAAIVLGESDDYPMIGDVTADFTYARLMRARAEIEAGYPAAEIDHWADVARAWAAGDTPPSTSPFSGPAKKQARDAFMFFISGAKERNPAAARALLEKLAN
jgi:uncharacterized protein YecE (DUF72 family)